MRIDVIDVSHWNTVSDHFAGAKQIGALGVIIKATQGTAAVDPKYLRQRADAEAHGLLTGFYHFMNPGNAELQANHFIDILGGVKGAMGHALVLDWENPNVTIADAQKFCERVHELVGRYPVMYSYSAMLIAAAKKMTPTQKRFWSQTKLWLAQYSAKPAWPTAIWKQWWLWQYTGDGHGPGPHDVPGDGHNVDISQYHGDRVKLATDWA